jgi:hypothetical protein
VSFAAYQKEERAATEGVDDEEGGDREDAAPFVSAAAPGLTRPHSQVQRAEPERRVQRLELAEAAVDEDGGRVEADD